MEQVYEGVGTSGGTAGSGRPAAGVPVWDAGVRLFHWSLVGAVLVAAITGFIAPTWYQPWHVYAGYAVGGLVLFRLLWGFLGSAYARFASFVFSPRETLSHLRGLLRGEPSHYVGHNPAGALMVFALIGVLLLLVATGLFALGGQEKQGMLASFTSYDTGHAAKEVHELLAFALLLLIGGHLMGVILESRLSRENLVRAMLTGRKRNLSEAVPHRHPAARPMVAVIAGVLIAAPIGYAAVRLAGLPPRGVPQLAANPAYATECGACHFAYHPSLLPAASWRQIMTGLGDHFGEDASLEEPLRSDLEAWLVASASEHWDTESANRLRLVAAEDPLRITATPFWVRKHNDVDAAAFRSKAVGGKGNCLACHKDAASGRFDDAMIGIPKP